jgi:hypothetical protein
MPLYDAKQKEKRHIAGHRKKVVALRFPLELWGSLMAVQLVPNSSGGIITLNFKLRGGTGQYKAIKDNTRQGRL